MLATIEVRDASGKLTASLPVSRPNPSAPFKIRGVDGLGPVKANIVSSTFASEDGAFLEAFRTGQRDILIGIGYNPIYAQGQSIESLRRDLYKVFLPKTKIDLRFIDTVFPIAHIEGIVESQEPAIFAKEPQVVVGVSCGEATFSGLANITQPGSNEYQTAITDLGTAPSGFLVDFLANKAYSKVTISNGVDPDLVYNGPVQANDRFRLSTNRGQKFVNIIRAGTTLNVVENISGPMGMNLRPETEYFTVKLGQQGGTQPYTFTYRPRYVGL